MGDAFTARAVLHRERDNLTREVISVDIKKVLDGTIPDIPLQKNDVLYIPSIHDLQDMGVITVFGEVARPGDCRTPTTQRWKISLFRQVA